MPELYCRLQINPDILTYSEGVMGHNFHRNLPLYPKWKKVIRLLEEGAGIPEIAAATIDASREGVEELIKDRCSIYALWLLTQIPSAASSEDFPQRLQQLNLPVSEDPNLFDIMGAFSKAVDTYVEEKGEPSDFVEMVQMSAVESLTDIAGGDSPTLFQETTSKIQDRLKEYDSAEHFRDLAREFFGRLVNRYMDTFLSTELPNHVGENKRFANISEYTQFSESLYAYSRSASRKVEEFAGNWYSRTRFNGGITEKKAGDFLQEAMTMVTTELERGGPVGED
ncbi:MAG: hypothetical protein L6Q94_04505 [Calditrichia bacterium]|nr:hypothetical protein [Calditrichia bacterium]